MRESEGIQAKVNHVLIQTFTVAVMVLWEADVEPRSYASTPISREVHRQKHVRSGPKQPSFNWNVTKYVDLLNLEMEVTNILKTKTYELWAQWRQSPHNKKNWFDREGLQHIKTIMSTEKEVCKTARGLFSTLNEEFKQSHKPNSTFSAILET